VSIQYVPDSSPLLYGLVNYHGKILPVLNFRYRLGIAEKPVDVHDFFIIAITAKRMFCIVVDRITGILDAPEQDVTLSSNLDEGLVIDGVFKHEDGLCFIYDLEKFITGTEQIELNQIVEDNTDNIGQ
jgi:chemotaxis signal transduction protein